MKNLLRILNHSIFQMHEKEKWMLDLLVSLTKARLHKKKNCEINYVNIHIKNKRHLCK